MKSQEVISIFVYDKHEGSKKENVLILYPELEEYFNRGMYLERITQTSFNEDKCLVTFVFRYYNSSQSKVN